MKSSLPPPLLLLLALATPSITAPIPLRLEDCLRHEPCRFALPAIFSQQESEQFTKDSTALEDPRFPSPQRGLLNEDNAGDLRLLLHHLQQHAQAEGSDLPPLNPKLESVLRAAAEDKISTGIQTDGRTGGPTTVDVELIPIIEASHVEVLRKTDARRYGLAGLSESVWKKVESIASKSLRRCRTHHPTVIHQNSARRDGWIIMYSYGYRCVRTGYTDVLVVGIVVLFIAAMLMVEVLDRALELTRSFLSLDQGRIRLEDESCVRPDYLLSHWFNDFYPIPTPPREKSMSAFITGEPSDEKPIES